MLLSRSNEHKRASHLITARFDQTGAFENVANRAGGGPRCNVANRAGGGPRCNVANRAGGGPRCTDWHFAFQLANRFQAGFDLFGSPARMLSLQCNDLVDNGLINRLRPMMRCTRAIPKTGDAFLLESLEDQIACGAANSKRATGLSDTKAVVFDSTNK